MLKIEFLKGDFRMEKNTLGEKMETTNKYKVVCFGDSITWLGWPKEFYKRLRNSGVNNLSVVKAAIPGNRILHDSAKKYFGFLGLYGPSGVSRFEKAISKHKNVKYVIVLHGINDLIHPGPNGVSPASEIVTAEQIIGGLQTYIDIAHKNNIKIYGGTIMPIEGYKSYAPDIEEKRQLVNSWIRSGEKFDGVIDFEKAIEDPDNPRRLRKECDHGDHLHPNKVGTQVLANAIDLNLFK